MLLNGDGCSEEGGGWRVEGGGGRRPERPTPLDTIQSEQSSVAVSTFSSASKCQAMFAHKHTHMGENTVRPNADAWVNWKKLGTKALHEN